MSPLAVGSDLLLFSTPRFSCVPSEGAVTRSILIGRPAIGAGKCWLPLVGIGDAAFKSPRLYVDAAAAGSMPVTIAHVSGLSCPVLVPCSLFHTVYRYAG